MRKRITSLLLTLVMLLSLVPAMGVTASAADGFTEVSTYGELKDAVDKGSAKIKLVADIDTTSENSGVGVTTATNLSFKGSGNVLDLNGHKLKLVANMSVYFIKIYSTDLTIKDSGTGGRIDFEYGSGVLGVQRAIVISRSVGVKNAGSLTVDGGTLSSTYRGIILIESFGSITINGGRLYAPVTNSGNSCYIIHSTNRYDLDDTLQLHVNGGELDGRVVLKRDDSFATGTLKYKVTPIKITGGTFKQGLYTSWGMGNSPEGEPKNAEMTMDSPTVEITGGVFERNNNENSSYASLLFINLPTKLRGGTFKAGVSIRFAGGKYTWDATQPQYRASIGNSAILCGNDIRTAYDWSKSDWFEIQCPWIDLGCKGGNPITVIPNAWGMKSVTLDGNPIDYAKDWNGGFEELNNDTAHTIKFEWKDLAPELSAAGYSYNATCDRYISGSTTPTTDTISATDTEYSFTIDKDAPAKVYSFALHLNLKKTGSPYNVGIMSNEHIVKLVVSEAPVVVPDPTIEGTVYYTSGIVYGSPISIAASVTPAEATKSYQWQRSTDGGSTWTNIEDATSGKYTPVAADMGKDVRIRVVVTANGYLGEIVGAPLTVSKAANDDTPRWPDVVAQKDGSDAYTKFEITNYNPKQEYVYTDSPATGNEWPTPPSGTPITSATVEELDTSRTYYIYTRYKGTDTHQPGSKFISSSVLMDEITKLNRIILTDESGKDYSPYGSGNTIYIKEGESMTLTAKTNPDGANTWNDFKFKPEGRDTSSNFTVIDPTGSVTSSTGIHQVTIRGDKAGTDTLAAEYSSYPAPQNYGTWRVHVYENVSGIGTGAEITVSPSFPDMTMYVGDTMTLPEYEVSVYPKGALDNYDLAWRIIKVESGGATYPTSNDNITLEDGKIKAETAHATSEKTLLGLVAIDKKDNTIRSLSPTSRFYVTVTEAPVIELTGITVAPKQVNLDIDGTYQLSAVKEPVNAAGTLNWESSNTDVATVDGNGMVTAVAKGEATITVSYNGKFAKCTVLVAHTHDTDEQPYLYLDPGNHYQECTAGDDYNIQAHTFTPWTDNKNGTHSRHCTVCKMKDGTDYTETAEHTWVWVVDQEAALNQPGKQHEECTGCPARRSENTVIPALQDYAVTVTGGTATAAAGTITRAMEGVEVTVTAQAPAGKHFVKWVVKEGGVTLANETSATTTFIMPATDVEIEANFEKNASTGTGTGATTYPITVKSAKNGDVTASHKSAAKGALVTLTVDPDKGYVLDTLTVLDGNDKELKLTEKNGKYTFTMPDSKVTVAATFKPLTTTGKHPFTDVPAGSYYEDAVVWAVGKNITTGMSATTFDPNGSCTRAQIVTFLWRAAGSPEPKTMKGFDDVASNAYYAKAVAWAVENGITTGTSASKFSPNDPCTRTQAVTFLFRYAAANGMEAVTMQELLSGYADAASVPSYAVSAMNWALAAGILQGDGVKLMPNATCTRAQIVTFIYRSVK